MQTKLTDYNPAEIAELLGLKPFQGQQLFKWIHSKQVFDFDAMTNLSKDVRARLKEECIAAQLSLVEAARSSGGQGTKKDLFRLLDGETVEAVLLRDRQRVTLCLSTQVGCAVRCAFCATGQSGFVRNLSSGEIVEQALHLIEGEGLGDRTPNVVYMGMGEPFRNYDAVMKSIRLLMRKDGLGIGARKITVSTVGEVEGIERLAQEKLQVRLSVSLHAANDELRTRLVPLNAQHPLRELLAAVRHYSDTTGRQVTFEWALMDGVNDSRQDAAKLIKIARDLRAFVNVIPYNPVSGLDFKSASEEACTTFLDTLVGAGVKATPRTERGGDIDAACGQLRRRTVDGG